MLQSYNIGISFKAYPEETPNQTFTFRLYAKDINTARLNGTAKAYQLLSGGPGILSEVFVSLTPEPEPEPEPAT